MCSQNSASKNRSIPTTWVRKQIQNGNQAAFSYIWCRKATLKPCEKPGYSVGYIQKLTIKDLLKVARLVGVKSVFESVFLGISWVDSKNTILQTVHNSMLEIIIYILTVLYKYIKSLDIPTVSQRIPTIILLMGKILHQGEQLKHCNSWQKYRTSPYHQLVQPNERS